MHDRKNQIIWMIFLAKKSHKPIIIYLPVNLNKSGNKENNPDTASII